MKKKILALILTFSLLGTYGLVGSVFALEDGSGAAASDEDSSQVVSEENTAKPEGIKAKSRVLKAPSGDPEEDKPIHNGAKGYDSLQTAIEEATDGDTITVDKPVEIDKTVDLSKSVTIKLNADLTVKGDGNGYKAGMLASKDTVLNITSENGSKISITNFYEGLASSNSYVTSTSYPATFYSIQLNIQGNAVADFSGNAESGMFISAGENGSTINVEQGAKLIADSNAKYGCRLVGEGKTTLTVKGEASFNNNYTGIIHMFNDGTPEIIIEVDGGVLNLNSNANTGVDTAKFGTVRILNGGTANIKENVNTGAQNATLIAADKGTLNVEDNKEWGIFYCDVTAESGGTVNAVNNKGVGIGDYEPKGESPFGGFTAKKGSKVLISGNNCGLYLNQPGIQVNVEAEADFDVTDNKIIGIFSKKKDIKINLLSGKITENNCSYEGFYGAGITNFYGDVVIGGTCQVWNNSTTGYGDDIANFKGTVTLRNQSSDNLTLKDGSRITGWYYDGMKDNSETKRWSADNYYEEVTGGKLEATGATGIKAAHGKPADPYIPPATVDPQPEPDPGEGGEIIDDPEEEEAENPEEPVKPEITPAVQEKEESVSSSKKETGENKESENPQTGDNSMIALYAVIALGAAGTVAGLTFRRRKEQ